jgi:peptide/nickel transport system substrate-binding protein
MNLNRALLPLLLSILFQLTSCDRKEDLPLVETGNGKIYLKDTNRVSPSWSNDNKLVIQLTAEPDNLHPTNGTSGQRAELFALIHRFLVTTATGNGLQPDLLEALPTVSSDGLTYSYRLKSGITWDDGSPLTAEDVYFTCKVNSAHQTNNPAFKSYWNNLLRVETDDKDPLVFRFIMKNPHQQNVSFLTSFPILQRSYFDPENRLGQFTLEYLLGEYAEPPPNDWFERFNNDSLGRKPDCIQGLGDYKVAEWNPGTTLRLKRKKISNTNPDEIIFKIVKDEQTVALELKNQVFDVSTYLSTTTFLQLAAEEDFRKNYHCVLSPTYNYSYLCFNERPIENRTNFFGDKNVRKAIAKLVPVDRIIQLLYREYGSACRRMVSNVSPFKADADASLQPIPIDINRANQLLAEAGYADSNNDGILDKQGIPFEAELLYLNTSADWKDMAGVIADALGKAGIRILPVAVEQHVFLEKAKAHDFDLLLGSWGGSELPEDYSQLWSTASWASNGSNYSGFGDTTSDSLIAAINTCTSDTLRLKLSHQLQQLIYEDQPYVFLYTSLRRNIIHKRWGNVALFPERPGLYAPSFRLISSTTNSR